MEVVVYLFKFSAPLQRRRAKESCGTDKQRLDLDKSTPRLTEQLRQTKINHPWQAKMTLVSPSTWTHVAGLMVVVQGYPAPRPGNCMMTAARWPRAVS